MGNLPTDPSISLNNDPSVDHTRIRFLCCTVVGLSECIILNSLSLRSYFLCKPSVVVWVKHLS